MSDDIGRVMQNELSVDRRWHLPAVYEVEYRRIESWLKRRAREALSGANSTLEGALGAAKTHAMTIAALFARRDENRDYLLLERARLGKLASESPSRASIILFRCLAAIAAALEVAIFVAMYLLDQSNVLIVTSGFILAAGGYLIGFGLGNKIGFKDEEGRVVRGAKLHDGLLWGGIVLVAGMAYIRSGDAGEDVGIVVVFTTLIALCVALFEALETWTNNRYRDRSGKMFLCQVWYATERHLEGEAEGLWEQIYETEVKRLSREGGITLER